MYKIIFLALSSLCSIAGTCTAFMHTTGYIEVVQPTNLVELIMFAGSEANLEKVQKCLGQLDIHNDEHLKAIHGALLNACLTGGRALAVVEFLLLQPYVQVNYRRQLDSMSALDAAAIHNNKKLIYLLLNHGADWSSKWSKFGLSPLETAQRRSIPFIAQWLQLRERLFNAVNSSNCNEIITLAQEGIALSIKDDAGNTPLHLAILSNKTKVVKTLLQLNPYLGYLTDKAGLSCFELAFKLGNTKIALMLLSHTPCDSTDIRPALMQKCLIQAIGNNKFGMIKFLMNIDKK